MALITLKCSDCGKNSVSYYGSWDMPLKVVCKQCAENRIVGTNKALKNLEELMNEKT